MRANLAVVRYEVRVAADGVLLRFGAARRKLGSFGQVLPAKVLPHLVAAGRPKNTAMQTPQNNAKKKGRTLQKGVKQAAASPRGCACTLHLLARPVRVAKVHERSLGARRGRGVEQLARLVELGRVLEAVEADRNRRQRGVLHVAVLGEPGHQVRVPQQHFGLGGRPVRLAWERTPQGADGGSREVRARAPPGHERALRTPKRWQAHVSTGRGGVRLTGDEDVGPPQELLAPFRHAFVRARVRVHDRHGRQARRGRGRRRRRDALPKVRKGPLQQKEGSRERA